MTLLLDPEPAQLVAPEPGYDVVITPELVDGEVVYMASHPDLPGCRSDGATPAEAERNLADAREMYIEALESSLLPVPDPKPNPRSMIATIVEQAPATAQGASVRTQWRVTVSGGNEMTLGATRGTTSSA